VTTVCLLGLTAGAGAATRADVELKIGIVQRFGEEPTDHETASNAGRSPHTQFQTGDAKRGWQQTLPASGVNLEVVMQPLPTPAVKEQVVLSHRSFETAENTASSGVRGE